MDPTLLPLDRSARSRRPILIAALLAMAACSPSEAPVDEAGEPGLQFISDEPGHFPHYHDFGKVRFGSRVEHTYVLKNYDPEPVVIQSIQTACHCTQIDRIVARTTDGAEIQGSMEREPKIISVPPRAELHLTLAVDTGILLIPNADKLSIVRMRTSSPNSPFVTMELKVTAQKLFQVSPSEVRLDEVPVNNGQTSVVRILRGEPSFLADVLDIKTQGKWIEASLEKDFHFEDPVWTLNLTVPPGDALGPFKDRIVLRTTDDEGNDDEAVQRELPIPIYGRFVDDVQLYPKVLTLGQLAEGETGEIDAYLRTLAPGARVKIDEAEVLGPLAQHFNVLCTPRAEDSQGRSPVWDIRISTDGKVPVGTFAGTLRLKLDDSQKPLIERRLQGTVLATGG